MTGGGDRESGRNGDEYGRPAVFARLHREEPVVGSSAATTDRPPLRGERDQGQHRGGGDLLVERPALEKRDEQRYRVRLVQRLDNTLLPRCVLALLLVRLAHALPRIRELHGDIGPVRVRRSERLHQSIELQRFR